MMTNTGVTRGHEEDVVEQALDAPRALEFAGAMRLQSANMVTKTYKNAVGLTGVTRAKTSLSNFRA